MTHMKLNKIVWIIIGLIAFIVSLTSIIWQSVYSDVVSPLILPGTISQDTMTAILSIVLIYLSLITHKSSKVFPILSLSILLYLFYAYAIYSIEQLYTVFYLAYLAITAMSFYGFILGILSIDISLWKEQTMPKYLKNLSIVVSLFIVILFSLLWISQLIPLIQAGFKQEFTFSIYILDLIFIMPGFIIISYLLYMDNPYSKVLAPILFFKAFTLLFSVGLGYYFRLFYNISIIYFGGLFYFAISLLFLGISLFHFKYIRQKE